MGKSKAKKPILAQKKIMSAAGLIVKNWLVLKETDEELHLVSRGAGKTRKVKKDVQRTVNNKNTRGKLPRAGRQNGKLGV